MAKPNGQKPRLSTTHRGRERAPIVSIIIALSLIIACAVFLGAQYLWNGDTESGDNDSAAEQELEDEPFVIPAITEDEPTDEPPDDTEIVPVPKTPAVIVKGLYIDARAAADTVSIERYIELCNTSEINALVIDVKDDWGQITYVGGNEDFSGASRNIIPNIEQLVSRLKEQGIYTIARLVCFKDPLWSDLYPELAIRDVRGATWRDAGGIAWLDPYKTQTWEYLADLAVEVAQIGFDEIQLDYVRFPADGRLGEIDYGRAGAEKTKADIIGDFLLYIRQALVGTSAWLSADVFGIIAMNTGDFENIGQDLDLMLQNVDYICPMIYPSHFANKSQNQVGQIINGILFETPDKEPYEVIYNILRQVRNRLPDDGNHAIIRPYLQAFTASYLGTGNFIPYTAHEISEQIQAVYGAGFEEWIMWNPTAGEGSYENVISLMRSENSDGSSSDTPAVSNA